MDPDKDPIQDKHNPCSKCNPQEIIKVTKLELYGNKANTLILCLLHLKEHAE